MKRPSTCWLLAHETGFSSCPAERSNLSPDLSRLVVVDVVDVAVVDWNERLVVAVVVLDAAAAAAGKSRLAVGQNE